MSARKRAIGASVLASVLCAWLSPGVAAQQAPVAATTSAPFVFTAAADYSGRPGTTATLDQIAAVAPAFHLALGDFNYDPSTPDLAWCEYFRQHVPDSIPVEIVAGNREDLSHEEDASGTSGGTPASMSAAPSNSGNGSIDTYATCLPDQMPDTVGNYGRQYFFDYPPQAPVARFILLSPRLTYADGIHRFEATSSDYSWANWAVADARSRAIPWVIVAVHKSCLTMGVQDCASGHNFSNLVMANKPDLVLQGHDHTYQRSKQLSLNAGRCEILDPNSYNADCVVDASGETYEKDRGTVFVTVGTGGAARTTIDPGAPTAPYFAAAMGSNTADTSGFLKVTLAPEQLHAAFQASTTSDFTDEFTILAPGASQ